MYDHRQSASYRIVQVVSERIAHFALQQEPLRDVALSMALPPAGLVSVWLGVTAKMARIELTQK